MSEIKLPHDHGKHVEYHFDHMPNSDDFCVISDVFKLLGDSSRVRIFWLLCHCEECVINISALAGMSSPAVSHHLKLLKASGLIVSRREGKEVYYKAADTEQVKLLHQMIEMMVEITCPSNISEQTNGLEGCMGNCKYPLTDNRTDKHTHKNAADTTDTISTINTNSNDSRQTKLIKEVHELLVNNLDQRFTIDELAKRFLINTSTLKQTFKTVYGQPIASYMKEYRIHKAMDLLRTTDASVADIALQLGYHSQSRFSEAFKDITQMLPTDYRKQL